MDDLGAISWRAAFVFQATTAGILLSSLAAGRLARRYRQRTLILAGFAVTIAGIIVLLALVKGHPGAWYFAPGPSWSPASPTPHGLMGSP
jgi:MFS family permease